MMSRHGHKMHKIPILKLVIIVSPDKSQGYIGFTLLPHTQPLRAVRVLFSPMVSGWAGGHPVGRAGGRAAGKSLSGLYLRNRKV